MKREMPFKGSNVALDPRLYPCHVLGSNCLRNRYPRQYLYRIVYDI